MKFAHKFVIFLFFALAFAIGANIAAFGYFSKQYFAEYLDEAKTIQKTQEVDVSLLGSVIEGKWLDRAALEEYRATIKDLGSISDSLERFSKNPEAFVAIPDKSETGATTTSNAPSSVKELFSKLITFDKEFPSDSPEWHFISKMLRAMGLVNLVAISLLLILSRIWIARAFRPIRAVAERIRGIAARKDYTTIEYNRKDEFQPLVLAINELSHNLSLQEKIRLDLLSDLSHEIRTPIAAIRCYLEGMEDGVIPMGESTLSLLFAEIERLVKITDSIIEIERTEWMHWSDLRVEKTDLTELMSRIIEEYAPLLKQSNQVIDLRGGDRRFFATVDRDMFMQIFHNLASNFQKYAGPGSTLTVRFFHAQDSFWMVFEDDGKGVPSDEIPFLREKFYQVDKTRTNVGITGSGIGLSVIEKIVKLHAGTMEIEGEESKFFRIRIRIPKNPSS